MPVLFAHGEDDDVIPVDVARACAEAAPRGELEVLPDCGHLVVLDQRGPLHEAVLRFERNLNTAGAR
ncbi:alpha/beta fold hydrolase [Nocardioides massiliensis]|uniref:alpha/beta fold hydrolase n=1 Tax=Nocardioides massiliensis TaxID=1325935 RepID=UPI0034CDE121